MKVHNMIDMIVDDNQLLEMIKLNIMNKIPSSFIRKGDGENIFIETVWNVGYRFKN